MFGGPFLLFPAFLLTPVFMQVPYFFASWFTLFILKRKTNWVADERPARIAGVSFLLGCLLHGAVWIAMHAFSLTGGTGISHSRILGAPVIFSALALGIWLIVLVRRQRIIRSHAVKVFVFAVVSFIAIHTISFVWAKQHLHGAVST